MGDFAFRSGKAMQAPAELRRAKSGLWSFEADTPRTHITKLGYLTKEEAKAYGTQHLLHVYGRTPRFTRED
jgi:hypothetical protein